MYTLHTKCLTVALKKKELKLQKMLSNYSKRLLSLNFENIRADILKKAVLNRQIEEIEQKKSKEEESGKSRSWPQTFKTVRLAIYSFIMQNRGPSALPNLISDARDSGSFDQVR